MMLSVEIPSRQVFVDKPDGTTEIEPIPGAKIQLEHSLISLRKWESIWHKPFLAKQEKSLDEMISYIQCMTITTGVDPKVYRYLPKETVEEICKYLEDPKTAATFNDKLIGAQKRSNEVVTAETIYWWMISLNIPVEFQKWNLSQLLALIKFVNAKNAPKQKMSANAAAQMRHEANMRNRALYNTKG